MPQKPWRYFRIGLMSVAVPILGIAWWIYVSQTNIGEHSDMVRQYLSPFPEFLQNARLITWIQLAFCGAAFLSAFNGLDEKGTPKIFNLVLLCLSGLVASWLLFSLM